MKNLMIKAIKEFSKQYKGCEIRHLYVADGTGTFMKWKKANFFVEYIDEDGGEYKSTYIRVEKK